MSENNKWIPVSERLPEDNKPVNITWVNRKPVNYYKDIKDKPFTATGVYYKGDWYWWSAVVEDYLAEYGKYATDKMNACIEVIAWQDLPAPYGANQCHKMSEKTNEDKYISEKGLLSNMKMHKTLFDTEADYERACDIIRHMPHKLRKDDLINLIKKYF